MCLMGFVKFVLLCPIRLLLLACAFEPKRKLDRLGFDFGHQVVPHCELGTVSPPSHRHKIQMGSEKFKCRLQVV